MQLPNTLIISRTDNLGDVILTLTLAGYLKTIKPTIKIYFIGKTYTEPIIRASHFIDGFLDREQIIAQPNLLSKIKAEAIIFVFPDKELAKIAYSRINIRIATSHRWFHWLYCNELVNFSRKNSPLHESQLNCKLLKPFNLEIPTLQDLGSFYGLVSNKETYSYLKSYFKPQTLHLIIHPKSKGSAREWKIENYYQLITKFRNQNTQIFITGVATEGDLIRTQCPEIFAETHVTDLTGKLNMEELITFIGFSDGLLACSTGTLHIAAALGIFALGLYPPMKPIHPQRWQPLGKNANYITAKDDCNLCKKSFGQTIPSCICMQEISIDKVFKTIMQGIKHIL